jgi:hypothetical protein
MISVLERPDLPNNNCKVSQGTTTGPEGLGAPYDGRETVFDQAVCPATPILFVSEIYAITYKMSIEILSAIPLSRHE